MSLFPILLAAVSLPACFAMPEMLPGYPEGSEYSLTAMNVNLKNRDNCGCSYVVEDGKLPGVFEELMDVLDAGRRAAIEVMKPIPEGPAQARTDWGVKAHSYTNSFQLEVPMKGLKDKRGLEVIEAYTTMMALHIAVPGTNNVSYELKCNGEWLDVVDDACATAYNEAVVTADGPVLTVCGETWGENKWSLRAIEVKPGMIMRRWPIFQKKIARVWVQNLPSVWYAWTMNTHRPIHEKRLAAKAWLMRDNLKWFGLAMYLDEWDWVGGRAKFKSGEWYSEMKWDVAPGSIG